ncbi:hypothetical protein [Methanobrevibacter sp.]|uniref:hypothetical protein n=1 Tax=Methanobrevibacter sp. TaxID=66852 RepID=UPI00389074B9
MDENLTKVLDDFRKMKIDYDSERFKLMSYQLENIINKYEQLIATRKEIQEEYFSTLENIKNNEIDVDIDYSRWENLRLTEDSEWKKELDELSELKYEIDDAIKRLENGEIERMLIEEEEKMTGDKIR